MAGGAGTRGREGRNDALRRSLANVLVAARDAGAKTLKLWLTPPPQEAPHSMVNAPKLLTRNDGPVAVITINRPEVRNALDNETAEALTKALRDFDRDEDRAVAVLTGAGGHFCAGADLKELASGREYKPWAGDPMVRVTTSSRNRSSRPSRVTLARVALVSRCAATCGLPKRPRPSPCCRGVGAFR